MSLANHQKQKEGRGQRPSFASLAQAAEYKLKLKIIKE